MLLPPHNRLTDTNHRRLGHPSGTCGDDKRQFCPSQWPEQMLGPVPREPPLEKELQAQSPTPQQNITTCGSYCSGMKDCGSADDEGCFCAMPSEQDARSLGLDVVATVAVCLGMNFRKNYHPKRERSFLDSEGVPYLCPCNETFVDARCCGVDDGMVFLPLNEGV